MSNFKLARESKGLSQKEIAITLEVSQPTVSEWESGKKIPAGKNLKRLVEILGCTSDYLLGVTDDPEPVHKKEPPIGDGELKFALWGRTDIDDNALEAVRSFAKFVAEQKRAEK